MALLCGMAEKLFDKFLGLLVVDELWELEVLLHYLFVNLVWPLRGVPKGQRATEKLIQTHPQRPQINQIDIAFTQDNIRCHIMRRANNSKGPCQFISDIGLGDLGGGQVNKFEVAVRVNQKVLGFDVTADYLYVLEVLEDKNDDRAVELGVGGG